MHRKPVGPLVYAQDVNPCQRMRSRSELHFRSPPVHLTYKLTGGHGVVLMAFNGSLQYIFVEAELPFHEGPNILRS